MRREPSPACDNNAHVRVIAWVASILPLALIALLGFTGSAQALPDTGSSLPPLPALLAAPDDEEEEEGEAGASEDEVVEAEECEAEEEGECEEEELLEAPPECLLSSVDATVFASGNRDRLRLLIRYTSVSPTAVTVAYGLHGAKGSLFLGASKKNFGKKGVLRLNRSLTEAQMAKVLAAKDFTVRIRALKAPGWCQSIFDRRLTLRRATPAGISWQQPE